MRQLLTLLILIFFISFTKAQANEPAIVIDSKGKVSALLANGKKIKAEPGAAFDEQTTLVIDNNSSLLLLRNGLLVEYKTSTFRLNETPLPETATLNFDPLFGEFVKASLAITFENAHQGNWAIKNIKKRGDSWGVTDPKSKGGWGVDDPKSKGSWGVDDPKNKGGWGVTDHKSKGSWGVDDPKSKGSWGVDDPKSKGGWGVTDPKSKGSWGVDDPKSKGSWGVDDPKSKGSWGVDDPKSKGSWGVDDPKSKGGWGASEMIIKVTSPGGLYKASNAKLGWIKLDGVVDYLVAIFDEEMNMVWSQISATDFVNADISKLDNTKTYYWQVFANMKRAVSPAVTFTIAAKDKIEEVESLSKDSDIYATASKEVKGMMDAVAYEVSGMFLETYRLYDSLVLAYPKNDLIRLNYAAFCLRMGQDLKAKAVVEKI